VLKYIKFPKIISVQDYELNKNNFLEYKLVDKNKKNIVLISMQNLNDERYWRMDEVISKILKDNGEVVFLIIDSLQDDIEIILGATYNSQSLNFSFAKHTLNPKEFEKRKKEISLKTELLQNVYKNNDNIVVYSTQEEDLKIVKQLFPEGNYSNKSLESLLSKIKFHQDIRQKIIPYAIVFVTFFILNFLGNLAIDNYMSTMQENNKKTKIKLDSEFKKQKIENNKFLKEKDIFLNIQQKALKLKDKIYYNKD